MTTRLVYTTLAMVLFAPVTGMAKPDCATQPGASKAMFTTPKNNDMVASCQANGVCILTAGARNKAGRVTEILLVGKEISKKEWSIIFWSLNHQLEISRGISIQIGDNDPIRIPPRLLSRERDPKTVRFESKLAKLVRNALLPKKKSTWTYTSKQGRLVETTFSHEGLVEAITWINCKVASGQ